MTQLQSTLEALKSRFKAGSFEETVTYYLSLGDGDGEKWTLTVTPESCHLTPGGPRDPRDHHDAPDRELGRPLAALDRRAGREGPAEPPSRRALASTERLPERVQSPLRHRYAGAQALQAGVLVAGVHERSR